MGRRPLVAMVVAWALVVVAVAAVTYVVVDRAGRGVGQASAARTVAPRPSGSASPAVSAGTGGPSTGVPTGPAASGPATPEPAATGTASPAAPRIESFTTEGGSVVASCAGATLRLVSITPRDGWRFDRNEFEVRFTGGEAEVELSLGCRRGVPTRLED